MFGMSILILVLLCTGIVLITEKVSYSESVTLRIKRVLLRSAALNMVMIGLLIVFRSDITVWFVLGYGILVLYTWIPGSFSLLTSLFFSNTAMLLTLPFCINNRDVLLQNVSGTNVFLHLFLLLLNICFVTVTIVILLIRFIRGDKRKSRILRIQKALFAIFFVLIAADLLLWQKNIAMDNMVLTMSGILVENVLLLILLLKNKTEKRKMLDRMAETKQNYDMLFLMHQIEAKELHDRKHHIQILRNFLADGKTEKAIAYLDDILLSIGSQRTEYTKNFDEYSEFLLSGNDIIDYVLAEKKAEADKKNIVMEIQISVLPAVVPIRSGDLCCLLSNAIDNAIESADRHIRIRIASHGEMLIFKIENDCKKIPQFQNGKLVSLKKDAAKHGYGIPIMEEIVKQYQGYITYDFDQSFFRLQILLNL